MASPFTIFLIFLAARWAVNNPKTFGRIVLSGGAWLVAISFVLGIIFMAIGVLETYAPNKVFSR